MINHLMQVAVVVQDLDRAVRFYRDTLGLKFLFQAPPGLAFFDLSGVRLMLDKPSEPLPSGVGTSILYYGVDDIQASHATLVAGGVKSRNRHTGSPRSATATSGWARFATAKGTCSPL
jgi:catechol 2,3-dioxygenase-like lactoylglutathione lyase family enzyme